MAIYKRGRGFELGKTENKSYKWPERDAGLRVRRADHSATKRAERRGLMKMIKILNDRPFTEY